MQHLHMQISEIKRLEWEELLWITDEVFRQEDPQPAARPIGVPVENDDDGT